MTAIALLFPDLQIDLGHISCKLSRAKFRNVNRACLSILKDSGPPYLPPILSELFAIEREHGFRVIRG